MKIVIDNTLLHRIGLLVDSPKSESIRPIDILGLFHIVEHILFAEEIYIPTYNNMFSHDRTEEVLRLFEKEGFSQSKGENYFKLDSWDTDTYINSCVESTWRVLDEIISFDKTHLRGFKGYVDDASNPEKSNIYDFNELISEEYAKKTELDELDELIRTKGTGTIQYMILSNNALKDSLKNIQKKVYKFSFEDSRALTTIFRVKVYQELAEKNYKGIYAPSPQRSKIVEINNRFFRYRLEKIIEQYVDKHGQYKPPPLIAELQGLNSLPLPLFAIHAFRNSNSNSPYSILEYARKMRDDPEIKSIRSWLTKWDNKLGSENQEDRLKALNKINQLGNDINKYIKNESIIADFQPGLEVSFDPNTGLPIANIGLINTVSEMVDSIAKRFEKNRVLIPVLARDLLTNDKLGIRLLKLINKPIRK